MKSKYKGCGILSFAFKEWMVTFEKRLKTSSNKLKIKINKKDETNMRTMKRTFKELKSLFFKKTNNFSVFLLKISSFTCPIAHWTMKKLLQTNIIKTKQFCWMKRNLNFIKIKKVEVRVPKITPACYFYARLKILLQNSLHVSLMRPRKKNYKNYFSVSMSCTLLKKKLPKNCW